jgi:foldase protein PrsA
MTLPLRFLALLSAFFVLAFALAACGGGGVPGNAVMSIGGDDIKKSEFDHWLTVAAKTQQQQASPTGNAAIPQPPEFTACIADKKKTAVKPAKGQPKPTDATYKAQCKQAYEALRDQVLQFLMSSAWIEGEAHLQGVKLSDAQIKKVFDGQRQASFPKDKDYLAFLKSSGYVQEDLLYRMKIQSLSDKLRTHVLEGTDKVSDAAVTNYYNKNKSRFAVPEQRDLKIILTKTKDKAEKAKAALAGGQSFKAVASKYSTDPATKSTGGVLKRVPKGQQEKALDAATFKAPKNKIEGPVKTAFGFYVFEVTKVTPAVQQPLSTSKASIKQLLISQQQQKTLDTFVKTFQKRWKGRTECRKDYMTANCKNAPKTKTNTTATTGAVTQNAPPASSSGTTTTAK